MLRRKKKSGSRRIQLDDASAETYIRGLVEAADEIRLPDLFARPHKDALFTVPNRHGVSHHDLVSHQHHLPINGTGIVCCTLPTPAPRPDPSPAPVRAPD